MALNTAMLLSMLVANICLIVHVAMSSAALAKMGSASVGKKRLMATVKSVLLLSSTTLLMWLPVNILSVVALFNVYIPNEVSR